MGFYSWNCRGCGESIKAPYDIPEAIEWQNDIVALPQDGTPIQGKYDGYGRVVIERVRFFPADYGTSEELHSLADPVECWHQRCWEKAGSPKTSTDASPNAEDQGFFYPARTDEDAGPLIIDRLIPPT
jgi:hypothetical protein